MSSNPDDVNYWRAKAEEYKRLWEEEKEEFKEFQYNSKELEGELETQLELIEKNNAELKAKLERLTIETESNNEKTEAMNAKLNRQVTSLQEEVNALKDDIQQKKEYIRKLEQVNDDLERSNRNALASVKDIEDRLNQVLEKNALLETELCEKEELNVCIQRLKDEVRDLNQELKHRARIQMSPEKSSTPSDRESRETSEAGVQTEAGATTNGVANGRPSSMSSSAVSSPRPLAASTRLAALNLVGDLLQKVSQLEANFATVCRCYETMPTKISKMNDQTLTAGTNGTTS